MPENEQKYGGVSIDAVAKATGRGWLEWMEFLDALGAQGMSHKEIVAIVGGPAGLANGGWQQSVAVGYEQARGMRVVGQTSGADFQIGVQKTLPVSPEVAWSFIADPPGRDVWLGECDALDFRKGEPYSPPEDISGEVRSVAPGQRLRLTWCSPDVLHPTTLQIYVASAGEKTSLRFHHERLLSLEEREHMREHWRGVLEQLSNLVAPAVPQ